MPISKARHKANERYNAKAYDEIKVRIAKGKKERIQKAAKRKGESVNALINRVVFAEVERIEAEGFGISSASDDSF